MKSDGRAFALVELLERSKKPEEGAYQHEAMEEGEDFESEAPMHCQRGLKMARAFLDKEENTDSPLRPKVEALASAYEDLMSALESAEG